MQVDIYSSDTAQYPHSPKILFYPKSKPHSNPKKALHKGSIPSTLTSGKPLDHGGVLKHLRA